MAVRETDIRHKPGHAPRRRDADTTDTTRDAEASSLTLLPQSIEAEVGVLGSIQIDPDALAKALAIGLRPSDFYRQAHRTIFQAMLDLDAAGQPGGDLILLVDELTRTGKLEDSGGLEIVTRLAGHVPTSANVRHYATIVRQHAYQRAVIAFSGQLAARAYAPATAPGGDDPALAALSELDELRRQFAPRTDQLDIKDGADLLHLDFPDPRWVVEHLIPEGLSLLVGGPKLGKSWLALAIAIATVCGGRALGTIPVQRSEVLYLALEDNQRRLKLRMQKLLNGDPLPRGLSLATEWPRLDAGGGAELNAFLDSHPETHLVIIDTLATIRPQLVGEGNVYMQDYQALASLKRIADERHIAIVVLHHVNKRDTEDPLATVSGSNGLTGGVDNVLLLKRPRGKDEGTLFVTGRDVDEQEYAMTFDATLCMWKIEGKAEDFARTRERQAVLDAIAEAGGPVRIADVAARLDRKYEYAKCILSRMAHDHEVVRDERGSYQLPQSAGQLARSTDTGPQSRARNLTTLAEMREGERLHADTFAQRDTSDTTDTLIPAIPETARPPRREHPLTLDGAPGSASVSMSHGITGIKVSVDAHDAHSAAPAALNTPRGGPGLGSWPHAPVCDVPAHHVNWRRDASGTIRCGFCHRE